MSSCTCIITGCKLRLEGADSFAIGDLFVSGDQFIFNASVERDMASLTKWHDPGAATPYDREIVLHQAFGYFERRGVFVMRAYRSALNASAQRYVGEALLDQLGVV